LEDIEFRESAGGSRERSVKYVVCCVMSYACFRVCTKSPICGISDWTVAVLVVIAPSLEI
jgi:hypothetical protein